MTFEIDFIKLGIFILGLFIGIFIYGKANEQKT